MVRQWPHCGPLHGHQAAPLDSAALVWRASRADRESPPPPPRVPKAPPGTLLGRREVGDARRSGTRGGRGRVRNAAGVSRGRGAPLALTHSPSLSLPYGVAPSLLWDTVALCASSACRGVASCGHVP